MQTNDHIDITIAYDLPFEARYPIGPVFSSGNDISLIAEIQQKPERYRTALVRVFELLTNLAATGALSGTDLEPWKSGLRIDPSPIELEDSMRFQFINSRVDEGVLIILSSMLLAQREAISLNALEVSLPGRQVMQRLRSDPTTPSTYPGAYRKIPFELMDENPEGGGYTFVAELRQPLQESNQKHLEQALRRWVDVILAGGYGLAPIPPQESYIEPDSDFVTSFANMIEWTVFKLRADPACVLSLVNIFVNFHYQCQELVSLTIS